MKHFKFLTTVLAFALPLAAGGALAQETSDAAATAAAPQMLVELNKAEQTDNGCQYFLLLRNQTPHDFRVFRMDLYYFDADGVISKRLLVDTPPVDSGDTRVAAFVASDLRCDSVSQILVNNVEPCEVAAGAAPDCQAVLSLENRTGITFFK